MADPPSKIIHCDCDCFYAAIEMRDDKTLAGRPVAVGGRADQRGVVATCNYEARAFGVHSAMPTAQATRLCPDLVLIRPAMDKYRAASRRIMSIYREFTDLVEPLSLDEAYLDVTQSPHEQGSATRIAQRIRARVQDEVGITISAGVAPNKFLAKIASDWEKPDGLYVIRPAEVEAFVAALPVTKLFGVGSVTAAKMHAYGLISCADVRARSRLELRTLLGNLGDRLYDLSRGVDHRLVQANRVRKSLSTEETYVEDLKTNEDCQRELTVLVAGLAAAAKRLGDHDVIHRMFIKIRFDNWKKTTVERAATSIDLARFAALLDEGLARHTRPVRLLGVGVRIAQSAAASQIALFDLPHFGGSGADRSSGGHPREG